MLKILITVHELTYTDLLYSTKQICEIILKYGYSVDVWSYQEGDYAKEFQALGIYPKIIERNSVYNNSDFEEAFSNYDLVIANSLVTYELADISKNVVPTIWYIHEVRNIKRQFLDRDYRIYYALKRAEKIYVTSEYAQVYITENFNENVQVVHNDVEDEWGNFSLHNSELSDKTSFVELERIETSKLSVYEENVLKMIQDNLVLDKEAYRQERYSKAQIEYAEREAELTKRPYTYTFSSLDAPAGAKIAIYAAGMIGRILYQYVSECSKYEAVLWVDKAYRSLENDKVSGLDSLFDVEYDYIYIAVLDEKVAGNIRDELVNLGIDENKIFWKEPEKYYDKKKDEQENVLVESVDSTKAIHMLYERWMNARDKGYNVADFFKNNEFKRIAIYGWNSLSHLLYFELNSKAINVEYVIEQKKNKHEDDKIFYAMEEELPEVDVVVITSLVMDEGIARDLSQKINAALLYLEDIVP